MQFSSFALLSMAAARGEWESAQFVLRASRPGLSARIEVGDLSGPGGASIPARAVEVRRVAYVPVPYTGKAWPDPLVPVASGASIALKPDENAPVLLTVRVPRDARPGDYRGELKVKTAFGFSLDRILKFEGIAPGTPEALAMHDRYWRTLVEHRISPYEIPVDILDPAAAKYLDDPRLTSFMIPYREDTVEYEKVRREVAKRIR